MSSTMPQQVTGQQDRALRFNHKLLTKSHRIQPHLHQEQQNSICELREQFSSLNVEVQNLLHVLDKSASPDPHVVAAVNQAAYDVPAGKTKLKKLSRRSSTEEAYKETDEKLTDLKGEWNRLNRQLLAVREALTRPYVPNAHRPILQSRKYSVFISHCGEDKDSMAIPLYRKLEQIGVPTFLDAAGLLPGHNGKDEMCHAMQTATIGVFIMSPEFAAKEWPMKELECFLRRRRYASLKGERVILIPVFYRLGLRDCKNVNNLVRNDSGFRDLLIEHGFLARKDNGMDSLTSLEGLLEKVTECTGIENLEHASNELSSDMSGKRDLLQGRIVQAVSNVLTPSRGPNVY